MKRRIVVLGSINMDIVARASSIPVPGQTVVGEWLSFIPGGKGANQGVAASRLGGDVRFVGRIGNDMFGKSLRDFLRKERMDTGGVKITKGATTGTAMITLDRSSQNTIVFIPGSNARISAADARKVRIDGSDIILSTLEVPQDAIRVLFERARKEGAATILNAAPALKCTRGFLSLADYIIVNEHEVAFFAKGKATRNIATVSAYAKRLRARKNQAVIVTLGPQGAFCIGGSERIRVKGIKVKAVDTTGAGDCFSGAFAAALAESRTLAEAMRFANKAASISVQRVGASSSMPTRKEVGM